MPLTGFQAKVAKVLAPNRSPDSHLAGAAALHFDPQSKRYSNDLDYFHDSVERVAKAYEDDHRTLSAQRYKIQIEMKQPGYIRAQVSKGEESTKIEWAHDSAWRFMPAVRVDGAGYQLHPIDIAVNKTLALAGRDEPRDFFDILYIHENILPLGALCWAAAGKDPGFTPASLLELLKRRGKYRPEDFTRLMLTVPVDLQEMKKKWIAAINEATDFIASRPAEEIGCLYYDSRKKNFVAPRGGKESHIVPHFGRPGGVLPRVIES